MKTFARPGFIQIAACICRKTVLLLSFAWLIAAHSVPAFADDDNSGLYLKILGSADFSSDKSADAITVPYRSLAAASFGTEFGYSFDFIAPFIAAEYQAQFQLTDPGKVGGQNTGGSGYIAGPGVAFHFGDFGISGIFDLLGTYTLFASTASGSRQFYSQPSGWRLRAEYACAPGVGIGLSYAQDTYMVSTVDGVKSTSSLDRLLATSYGIFISYQVF